MHIWLNQGYSSQRDLAELIKKASPDTRLTLTHRDDRKEIVMLSDFSVGPEPKDAEVGYVDFVEDVISSARRRGSPIEALVAQRGRDMLVNERTRLAAAGVRLAAGAMTKDWLDVCEDKSAFTTALCQVVPMSPTITVVTADDLAVAVQRMEQEGKLPCIKPSVGVYGAGFWILDRKTRPFDLYNDREVLSVHPDTYIDAFAKSGDDRPHIVMEYLPGSEASVDAVCDDGKVVSYACRTKFNGFQLISTDTPESEFAVIVADKCGLDGIVNIQFKRRADGVPALLEVNTRASGGVGYSSVAGINLANDLRKMLQGEKIEQVHLKEPVTCKPLNTYIAL